MITSDRKWWIQNTRLGQAFTYVVGRLGFSVSSLEVTAHYAETEGSPPAA